MQILSYDFPKIRNLPKIFLRSFENVGPDSKLERGHMHNRVAHDFMRLFRFLAAIHRLNEGTVCVGALWLDEASREHRSQLQLQSAAAQHLSLKHSSWTRCDAATFSDSPSVVRHRLSIVGTDRKASA